MRQFIFGALLAFGSVIDANAQQCPIYVSPGGTRFHEPPYTKAEEADFYRRVGRGPLEGSVTAVTSRTNSAC
jgi:hypothetical protein